MAPWTAVPPLVALLTDTQQETRALAVRVRIWVSTAVTARGGAALCSTMYKHLTNILQAYSSACCRIEVRWTVDAVCTESICGLHLYELYMLLPTGAQGRG